MNKWRTIGGVTLALWFMLGLGYPLVMTAISQLLFPYQASGSPVVWHGQIVASAHVGQYFNAPQYFWGRPSDTVSATGQPEPYNPMASGGSNLGPTNRALIDRVRQRLLTWEQVTPGLAARNIPASLVEGSGSGLDPDITPAAADIQIPRVAHATGLSPVVLQDLITEATSPPQWGIFGRTRVNVVKLNLLVAQLVASRKTG
ncbi:Potassium-transporting ATPase C chain [Sulfobacillus acidophilus DSM 10332]|uniref:Potassium-transporting ATPase KdpC subunit n=1 Tax=Sulfobacillus acidophilus (strain ATCC 700253 / DSM 10332 / NAL) TaxID=679936 RepID=G8TY78_SULAD|nr:Potassium-transporting ATPase C chain [Sulfobacillus acidophilus DSM 10332]